MTPVSSLLPDETRLRAVRTLDVLDTQPETAFDNLVENARVSAGAGLALMTIVDSERLWFKAGARAEFRQAGRLGSLCDTVVSTRASLVVLDTHKDRRFAESALVRGAPYVRFYAGAPIFCDGQAIGSLCVIDTKPRKKFLEDAAKMLVRFAGVAGELLTLRAKARVGPLSPEGPARRFAEEARLFAGDYARLVMQVDGLSQKVAHAGEDAGALAAIGREIIAVRDLALRGDLCAGSALAEFCSPDSILDRAIQSIRPTAAHAGVSIDYVRSFSDFLMLSDPRALESVVCMTLDCAIQQRGGPVLRVRVNFYDAHDGRRMLRLVAEGVAGAPPPRVLNALACAARSLGGGVAIAGDVLTLMVRAPLAGPAAFIRMQADIGEQVV